MNLASLGVVIWCVQTKSTIALSDFRIKMAKIKKAWTEVDTECHNAFKF